MLVKECFQFVERNDGRIVIKVRMTCTRNNHQLREFGISFFKKSVSCLDVIPVQRSLRLPTHEGTSAPIP